MASKHVRIEVLACLACVFVLSPSISHCQDAASEARAAATAKFGDYEHPPIGRFPYMCSIRPSKNRINHVCGGILLNSRWVLTAAHCVDPARDPTAGASPFLYCGIYDVEDENEENLFHATDIEFREEWNGEPVDGYDIALLKLNREAAFTTPRLPNEDTRPSVGEYLGGLGWGATATGTTITKLQYISTLLVHASATCETQWEGILNKTITLCAGFGSSDACKGDSGGPLLQADSPGNRYKGGEPQYDLIYGIISFGDGDCGNSRKAGVYTYVGYFRTWILSIIQEPESSPSSPSPRRSQSPSSPLTPSSVPSPEGGTSIEDVIVAIENDNAVEVRAALEQGFDPNARYNDSSVIDGDKDDVLLYWAARFDSAKVARVLIELGADVDARNNLGNLPLHGCSLFDSRAVAKILLENGAVVDAPGYNGVAPIHYASGDGFIKTVELLIKNGADVNAKNDDGDTPLHFAAWKNHADIAEELIRNGAEVDAAANDGETSLYFAAVYGSQSVVEVLLDAGASKTIRDKRGNRPSSVVCSRANPKCSSATESAIEDLLSL